MTSDTAGVGISTENACVDFPIFDAKSRSLKKTVLGAGSKASHLAYLGDATIGQRVNIGAGTITCNYDGQTKHATIIEDEVFIGSDSQLIAPVRIGRGAYVAAGSSIDRGTEPKAA